MITVSVIIPAYNEEKTIITLLERVRAQVVEGCAFEVIVIDDGSTDRTRDILKQRPELFNQLVEMPENGGKGAAVKAGLRHASGDYILFQDADLEYNPDDYGTLLKPVLKVGADVVMGSRLMAPPYTRVSYFWHKVGNRAITLLFNIVNNTTFTDIYSCYLMYRRDYIDPDDLRTTGWEQHAEILSLAIRAGNKLYEVPISYEGRTYDEGKKIRAYHMISVIWTIIRMKLFV